MFYMKKYSRKRKKLLKQGSRAYNRPISPFRFMLRSSKFYRKKRPYYGFTGYPDRCCKYDDNVFLPDELD